MKTMHPPGYHHNGFVTTHALGHMMYGYIYIYICVCVNNTNMINYCGINRNERYRPSFKYSKDNTYVFNKKK